MHQKPSKSRHSDALAGAAILTLSALVVKVIGLLYRIPMLDRLGTEGMGYFNTALELYALLCALSTAGLPVAMSRMISEQSSLGHYNQVRRTYKTAKVIFLLLGVIGTLLMTIFCRELAAFQKQPDAWAAIGTLGPCVLLICLMSTYRGFFQGQGNMMPTSISQVLEALCKLIVGMIAAIVMLKMTSSIPLAAAGAILGVTVSCGLSAVYLARCFRKHTATMPKSQDEADSYGRTAKNLLLIAIPITIGSAGLSILTMLETKIYMGQLLGLGYTQDQADTMKGIYDFSKTVFNMPCAFITPITISIIPAIASQLSLKRRKEAKATEESAVRIMGLISFPCAVGLAVLAQPVMALLGGYTGEKLELATTLMTILGICVVFNSLVLLTNAMLQAHGHVILPVIHMFIGGALKLVAVYILAGNPEIGILGGPIGSLLCHVTITVLNLITMRHCIRHTPAVLKNLVRPLVAALAMGIAAYGCWYGLQMFTSSRIVLCGGPVAVGAVVYLIAAIKCRVITRQDCLMLPKGEKIAKFLHLK